MNTFEKAQKAKKKKKKKEDDAAEVKYRENTEIQHIHTQTAIVVDDRPLPVRQML